jgi:hypothetical protein
MDHVDPAALPTASDPRVTEALADLSRLEDEEVDQHVAIFEMTHAKLRGLLTDQGHLA